MAQGKKLDCSIVVNGEVHEITTKHPLYRLRYGIMTRCYNASAEDYRFYQGRGIKMCEAWKSCFVPFIAWCLENGWQKGLVLDRIDNNKDYSPDNCRFITHQQNLRKMHKEHDMHGENAANAKLTYAQVEEIRHLLSIGEKRYVIAERFGVSKSAITAINTKQNWRKHASHATN